MEKLIVVVYVGIRQFMDDDAIDYLDKISQVFGNKLGDDVYCLIVPKRDTTEITVDCINQKLVDAELYREAEKRVKIFQDAIDEIMEHRKAIKKGED